MKTKHIAMWACPRTRSTAITRAFEQIDDCIIYDEPLHHFCFFNMANDYENEIKDFPSDYLVKYPNTNYSSIIEKLTGDLPEGKSFSFQKHLSYHLIPGFDKSWISKVKNFFLIRDPRETVTSYWKVKKAGGFNWEESKSFLGWEEQYNLFKQIQDITKEKPLVIDSGDLLKNPRNYLKNLCEKLGIDFSEKMIRWEQKKTSIISWENSIYEQFSKNVINSSGFFDKPQEINIPDLLVPSIKKFMPFYEEMYKDRMIV
ncbi:sulfotransferase domain-containing protein [Moorena sp. SIO3I6]|uniref:sulfotransferase-like domain-containing protein n=1 Tax=Moorena sp. SIO3I6 TaxID=2607831 RepID=UPI0013F6D15F|nr:sulfotransferase domain-containing protein [Moorena sp. SIO3I6]NEP27448.1 sulfotransferase domain-containing protein [Moorena sp. SIO3I6]